MGALRFGISLKSLGNDTTMLVRLAIRLGAHIATDLHVVFAVYFKSLDEFLVLLDCPTLFWLSKRLLENLY